MGKKLIEWIRFLGKKSIFQATNMSFSILFNNDVK